MEGEEQSPKERLSALAGEMRATLNQQPPRCQQILFDKMGKARSLIEQYAPAQTNSASSQLENIERYFNACKKDHINYKAERQVLAFVGFVEGVAESLASEHGENLEAGSHAPLLQLLHLLDRFHLVGTRLRRRYNGRQTLELNDEYDVQDLLRSLLQIDFDDVRPEEWTPSYAGGSSRMDFLIKQESIAIETKMTRDGLSDRKLGEELTIDTAHYEKHPNVHTLVCFVYDPDERLRNPRGIENDLTKTRENIEVITVVRPQ